MSHKSELKRGLYFLLKHDNQGSFATRHDRKYILTHFINDLVALKYKIPHLQNLKQKHIVAVVEHWKGQGLKPATLKNRLSTLRYLTRRLNKGQIVPSNTTLAIAPRQYVAVKNRALMEPDFSKITHPYLKVSLELQRVFGLRREECLKIKPHLADKEDRLELLPAWCKGGRGRTVPIVTQEQRDWLEHAKKIVQPGGSLIPPDKNYIEQRYIYNKQTVRAGLFNLHGLRHAYAQRRYRELTGWEAPINGGPNSRQLTTAQKTIDYLARMTLTEELGHSRIQIVANYLGR